MLGRVELCFLTHLYQVVFLGCKLAIRRLDSIGYITWKKPLIDTSVFRKDNASECSVYGGKSSWSELPSANQRVILSVAVL